MNRLQSNFNARAHLFHMCPCCGETPEMCFCPQCPSCNQQGDPDCYTAGHLEYTTRQLIGRVRLRIAQTEEQLQDDRMYLKWLLLELHKEQSHDHITHSTRQSELWKKVVAVQMINISDVHKESIESRLIAFTLLGTAFALLIWKTIEWLS